MHAIVCRIRIYECVVSTYRFKCKIFLNCLHLFGGQLVEMLSLFRELRFDLLNTTLNTVNSIILFLIYLHS